jgi:GDP-mannose 6-dehydrogenase
MGQRISIFGLGYVGCISAACLARDGHQVTGVDVVSRKVDQVNRGESPIVEPGLSQLLAEGVASRRMSATTSAADAVAASDVGVICVGTPSRENGSIDLQYVARVAREIGGALRGRTRAFTLLVRSTVVPGTTEGLVRPQVLDAAGPDVDVRFGFHPEFLREGTAIADYDTPARTVIGCDCDDTCIVVATLYPRITDTVLRTTFRTAELMKYADNAFHALKVAFANEIGAICKAAGVSGRELMSYFVQDTKLNLGPAYLRPGLPFGGSCLPKDLRALNNLAAGLSVDTVLLRAVSPSNESHKRRVMDLVRQAPDKRVAVLGLSFKHGTDDLRESPAVELVETLLGKGFDVRVFDPTIQLSALVGANLSFVRRELPHVERLLMPSLDMAIADASTVVVTTAHPEFAPVSERLTTGQTLVDLVGYFAPDAHIGCRYEVVSW